MLKHPIRQKQEKKRKTTTGEMLRRMDGGKRVTVMLKHSIRKGGKNG